MKILDIRTTVGPNIYSIEVAYLVVARVEFEHPVASQESQLKEAVDTLNKTSLSKLMGHGLLPQLNKQLPIAKLIPALGIALQQTVGITLISFQHIHITANPQVANLVFDFHTQASGIFAANWAVDFCNALQNGATASELELQWSQAVLEIEKIHKQHCLSPKIQATIQEAKSQNIPHIVLSEHALLQLGYGCNQQRIAIDNHSQETNPTKLNKLFPGGVVSRIPILAVTGTNGKTTTTRLLAHILSNIGRQVGFTSSEGIYIGNTRIKKGDCTGPISTQTVLQDPWVNTAVFEYPRGGLIRAGLGFDRCDISIVTNIAKDHLGSRDIETIDDMAQVKSVVPRSTSQDGYAILNADDERVLAMQSGIKSKVALFSLLADNEHVHKHRLNGGNVCILENNQIIIYQGNWRFVIEHTVNIPITFSGRAVFMIQNVLAASLAAFCHGMTPQNIQQGLLTFNAGVAQIPGRMNVFEINQTKVLIDYAHNPAGMRALAQYLKIAAANAKLTGIISGTGDRRDQDILEIGAEAANMFEQIVIREDRDLRGRKPGQVAHILAQGIRQQAPKIPHKTIQDPAKAIRDTLKNAQAGEWVCILGGDVEESIDVVKKELASSTRFLA